MDSLFFYLSKLLWWLTAPDSLILLLLITAFVALMLGRWVWAKILLALPLSILMVLFIWPVGEWLLIPLETRFDPPAELPAELDGIIVLAGSELAFRSKIWHDVELGDSAERLFSFVELAKRYPGARAVFAGGSGDPLGQRYKEADVARQLFERLGLAPGRVQFETNSRNTYENARNAYQEVQPRPGERWLLVTSARHMPRAVGVFRRVGWPVLAYPVDHLSDRTVSFRPRFGLAESLYLFNRACHEWLGLIAYKISGRSEDFLPAPEPP